MSIFLLVKKSLDNPPEISLRLLTIVSECTPRFVLLNHGSFMETPKQLIYSNLLNLDSFHKSDVIFILVEKLLDHIVSNPLENHFCTVLFSSHHLHYVKPTGPGCAQLSIGELFDSYSHFLPLTSF